MNPLPHTAGFWEGDEPRVLAPGEAAIDLPGMIEALSAAGLTAPLVVATSGTCGAPRWVVHEREGILASARAVVAWLGIGVGDRLGCLLPTYHVGGLGILARARAAKGTCRVMEAGWDPWRAAAWLEAEDIMHTSLVPTQVHDLVEAGVAAPTALRTAVVGGGKLPGGLAGQARDLGWPVLASFGMTETASQVATEKPGQPSMEEGWLPVIDGWEARAGRDGRLEVRGAALFRGELVKEHDAWAWKRREGKEGGWWGTSDRAEVRVAEDGKGRGTRLRPLGRMDDLVKIRGELVSVEEAEARLHQAARAAGMPTHGLAVAVLPDCRTGNRLVVAAIPQAGEALARVVGAANLAAPDFARFEACVRVGAIPRGDLGKVRRGRLAAAVQAALDSGARS